jgi:Flp pilus assembly protein TadG
MSVLLIGALGLAIDGGQMYAHRQMAQAAADAAAQAGIMSIFDGTNATAPHPFGTGTPPIASSACTKTDLRTPCVYARDNGFGGTTSDTVTLSFPATVSGVTLSAASVPAFAVTVQRTLKTGLIRFVGGPATTTITAKATAGLVGVVSPNCVYVLDPSAQNAFQATNGSTVALSGCALTINSTNSDAATVNGGSTVTATAISITGGASITNGGTMTPAPTTGVAATADPFALVASPAVGACAYTSYSKGSGTWTLNPGVYCGGISLSNGAIGIFNPGTYIINGGGISFAAGSVSGSGVMFYLTGSAAADGGVSISNGENVTFSAQTSGAYMGILFFERITTTSTVTFNGGATMLLTGTLYFPSTSILFSNGASTTANTAIVAKQVSFTGGTKITYDSTGLKTGLFSKSVALVQ